MNINAKFKKKIIKLIPVIFFNNASWLLWVGLYTLWQDMFGFWPPVPVKVTLFRNKLCRWNQVKMSSWWIFLFFLFDKLCLTLWGPHDCSQPGSSVHGISQARILEWVAICFSRRSSQPRDWACISCIGRWILYHWATREVPHDGFRWPYSNEWFPIRKWKFGHSDRRYTSRTS